MRATPLHSITLAMTLLALSTPPARAQGIFVSDFSNNFTSPASFALTATAKLRRGTTSSVTIVKDFIDLVPFGLINVRNGGTIVSRTNGRNAQGKGFITVKISVSATQQVGSTITLDVGASDHFNFSVERTGELTAVALAPNPSTVVAGTPVTINVTGTDLGTPALVPIPCHTVTMGNQSATAFTATATRNNSSSCATTNGPFAVSVHGSGANDPVFYTTSQMVSTFPFPAYLIPPPPPGVTCVSSPGIGRPIVLSPVNAVVITYAAGASPNQPVTIRWNRHTVGNVLAPNNGWIVTTSLKPQPGFPTPGFGLPNGADVFDTVVVKTFTLPGTHTVTIRAKNCDVPAPSTTVTFELRYQ
ncbi:MAG: hypothetical protein ABJE10_21580 [bacterium]